MNSGERESPPIQRQFQSIVDRLALPRRWTVSDLSMSLACEWGYRVVWVPLPDDIAPGLCGLQLFGRFDRVVLYRPAATPSQHRRVIAHAAAHLLLDHTRNEFVVLPDTLRTGLVIAGGGETAASLSALPDGTVDDHDEDDADGLADLLVEQSGRTWRGKAQPCGRRAGRNR